MKILISGGGIGGLTLAYWLWQDGHEPVIVEIAPTLRTEGYMIDFFGSGWDVAERMGLIDQIIARNYRITHLVYKNKTGKDALTLDLQRIYRAFNGKYVSFMRSDLEQILFEAIKHQVEIRFGTSIHSIDSAPDRVGVVFENGKEEEFDLVIGADGYHSRVRQLVFGPEPQFEKYLGFYVAAFKTKNRYGQLNQFLNYQEPNREAGLYPLPDGDLATLFVFSSPDLGFIPTEGRRKKLAERYRDSNWIIPRLISDLSEEETILFDKVSQIIMPRWSQGRVALIGDACACLTLMAGQGASMAMAGAYVLASELKKQSGDYGAAFAAYESFLKPDIEKKQARAQKFMKTFVPNSSLGIFFKRWATKLALLPLFSKYTAKSFGAESVLSDIY